MSGASDPEGFFSSAAIARFLAEVRPVEPAEAWAPETPLRGGLRSDRRHPVAAFHPYPTKVPPQVIRSMIEHYTRPGEVVLDAFGGSGMTGVAAREAGRHALLVDLSPLATFIARVNTRSHDGERAAAELAALAAASEAELGQLFLTREGERATPVSYYVWSDRFACPACGHEFSFFPHGVIHHGDRVETRASFPCPACAEDLDVRRVERVIRDGKKQKELVWVAPGPGRARPGRPPTAADLALAAAAEALPIPPGAPRDAIDPAGYSACQAQLGDKRIDDVTCLLSRRNLFVFTDLWARAAAVAEPELRDLCRATLTGIFTVISERQGYFGGGGGMSGNLYMPIVRMERNPWDCLRRKLAILRAAERSKAGLTTRVEVSTQSATDLSALPDGSVDYVFTDPPFGANIIYSEANLPLEAWLGARMERREEAVIDVRGGRDRAYYAARMAAAFRELYRVLKPGRWLTVVFHNTSPSVWDALQSAIADAGFHLAAVDALDKGSTTLLSDIRPASAKGDLLIAAQKPRAVVAQSQGLEPGRRRDVWALVEGELAGAPTPRAGAGKVVPARQAHALFGRMVAHHLSLGLRVPMSAAAFRRGLARRYTERDGMFFLPEARAVTRTRCVRRRSSRPGR